VLVDGRHGLKDSDVETMKLLDASAVSYAVVLTKRDEVKPADQSARIEATLEALRKHPAAYPGTFFTSSRTGEGIPELRGHIMQLMRERDGRGPPIVIASGSEAIQAKADRA
jgi:GTP-binding protein